MSCMGAGEEKSSYCYSSDVASSSGGNQAAIHSPMVSHLPPAFDPTNPSEVSIYNLTAGMEMIGFPPKNTLIQSTNSSLWKGFFNADVVDVAAAPSSSSKEINEPTSRPDHRHFYHNQHDAAAAAALMVVSQDSSPDWTHHHHHHHHHQMDDPSLRCVFPCEDDTERPNQRLSLSLNSSNNPSTIALQSSSFEDPRFGPSSSRSVNVPPHSQIMIQEHHFIKNSKFLAPAQELLNEFCNLGTNQQSDNTASKQKGNRMINPSDSQDHDSVIKRQALYSLDFLELQMRKTKLVQILEQVDRRYKHYCDQMKAVVSSFESAAGTGAASGYSALASKAMSRHFRCLKDAIVTQIKATKKAMGEKDAATAAGTMRGETPRLRLIDQTLRQQRALQQMNMMESHPWRPQRGLPERSVSILRAWLFEHFLHPYPSDVDKHILARQTGLSRSQVSNWFINARVRLWKPMVEEMYLEELKETDVNMGGPDSGNIMSETNNLNPSNDHKPYHDQLVRIDSDCLSSIVTNPDYSRKDSKDKALIHDHQNPNFAMELDFSSYTHHSAAYGGGGGGGVSLTLGLHQHGGFSPAAASQNNNTNNNNNNHGSSSSSLFYPKSDHMEDCQTVQYSLLDSESQNLPYRNLMGAQLLHDLAG